MAKDKVFIPVAIIFVLSFVLPISNAVENEDLFSFLSAYSSTGEAEITDVEELRAKWNTIEKRIRQFSSQEVGRIMSYVMDSQGNASLPQISTNCSRDLTATLVALTKMERWAFEMLDSAGRLPTGILNGHLTTYGDFDECLNVNAKGKFRGKYCIVEILPPAPRYRPYHLSNGTRIKSEDFTGPNSLTRSMIQAYEPHLYYFALSTSVCVPSSCTREDIRNIGNRLVRVVQNDIKVNVPKCQTIEDGRIRFSTAEIVSVVVLSVVSGMFILGSFMDYYMKRFWPGHQDKAGTLVQIILCFSAQANGKKLMQGSSTDSIRIFSGMKVVSMLWVVLNHTYLFVLPQVHSSFLFPKRVMRSLLFQVVMNGYYSVETFFFMSAVLLVYVRMKSRVETIGIFPYIFHRIWRLLPPSLFITAVGLLLRHAGTGPVWADTNGVLAENCRRYWWHNLLFINNYVDRRIRCIPWTWYLAVELHLYILSFPVILCIKKNHKRGLFIIGALLVVGILAIAVNHVIYHLPPTVIVSAIWTPDDALYYLHHSYYPSHVHIVTYAIGLAVGYIIYWKPKLHIPVSANVFGYIASLSLGLAVVYGVRNWNVDDSQPPGMLVSVLYACSSKIIYCLCLAWVTISCFTGNGGIISSLLSWKVFAPLSRLTYMVFLVHPLVQYLYTGSLRMNLQSEHRTMVYLYLAYVLASFLIALLFSLMFEAPFIALEKVIFRTRKSSTDAPPPAIIVECEGKINNIQRIQKDPNELVVEMNDVTSKA